MAATASPIPIAVTRHPHFPGRFTHLVVQADARARGWLCFGNLPLGVWPTREAARQSAARLRAKSIVVLREDRS